MNEQHIRTQSEAAYNQWAPQWREHAKEHSKYKMKSLLDFENTGIGKAVLCVANGFSFEENIEAIKLHKNNVDIIACDKTLGHLLNNGITPKFCMVCDANVDHAKYLEPWKDQLQDTILLVNVCGNPEWAKLGNWKDVYFFINKDIIDSQLEFSKLSGCKNFIPAGTNVSNAMVIMLTQSDNHGRRNFFGYDKILLIGFDYCWRYDGKYYSFDSDGGLKENYMRHVYCTTQDGRFAYTSGNLAFSAQWLEKYIRTFNLPIVQCSKSTILGSLKYGSLGDQAKYRYKLEDSEAIKTAVRSLRKLHMQKMEIEKQIATIGRDHFHSFLGSV